MIRDGGGAIVAVDQRAVNIVSQDSARLRSRVNLVGTLGPAPAGGRGGFGGVAILRAARARGAVLEAKEMVAWEAWAG